MALMGWRTEKGRRNYWESQDDAIAIVHAPRFTHAKKGYLVLIEKSKNPAYFKAKSRALKFARCYMKHENIKKCGGK